MEIKVDLISKELIKPSSPTPLHLSKLKFSFPDQCQRIFSMPWVLFYEKSNNITNLERCNLLKQSLSKTLTIFYPLAGRINNHSYADCNDEGALFIEAKANCQLSYILQNRNQYHNYHKKFIPMQPDKGIHQYGSLFQITYFNCGGLVVSFATPHILGDAFSQLMFISGWTAIARGDSVDIPSFGSSSIFPPKNIPGFDITRWAFKENVVTKSFVFDAFAISALRDEYSANGEKLSRVRALTIFILRRIMSTITREKDGKNNLLMVFNQVNVRPLLDLPNSKQLFGNVIMPAATIIGTGDEDEIPTRLQDAFAMVNKDSVMELQGEGESKFINETLSVDWLKGDIDKYTFSSLGNFPLYDIDFGWGKPGWATGCATPCENLIIFLDTKEGRGIEAWISMTEEDMAKFEKDQVLLSKLSSTHPNFTSRL